MRLSKGEHVIKTLEDWRCHAPPKDIEQWVAGRSAMELARAWCGSGTPCVPTDVVALLRTCQATANLQLHEAFPEHRIRFDRYAGEPRNADLAFVGSTGFLRVAGTVEAKADEPFGDTVGGTLAAALERLLQTPTSRGVQRISDLTRALFRARTRGEPKVASLRYQLLTAVAGSVAFALEQGADVAVLIIHEFITTQTRDVAHARNGRDLTNFLIRLRGSDIDITPSALSGPYPLPGAPLFRTVPQLFIGKATSNLRLA
jgi:hypothetical protein